MVNRASSLLVASPQTYLHWWTFVPVVPSGRDDVAYKVLKRQWADHTMNTLRRIGSDWLPGARGMYVATREDHLTTCLFHIWAAFPDHSWVSALLSLWDISYGEVEKVRWSYSWEQKRDRQSRPDITDIVLCWRDQFGKAALVIETKRPGGVLSKKDRSGGSRYLEMPSLRPIARRSVAYLVDERDRAAAAKALPSGTRLSTWQEMGRAQVACATTLPVSAPIIERVQAFIARHYSDLGVGFDSALLSRLAGEQFTGKSDRYDAIRSLALPDPVERFLLGSELTFCARTGVMPEAPMPWLLNEPSLLDVIKARAQTTQERELPLWQL
jgi:hypothetical protein